MTGCELIKCPDFKDGKCTNELDYVSKIDESPMCPRNDNAVPRENKGGNITLRLRGEPQGSQGTRL